MERETVRKKWETFQGKSSREPLQEPDLLPWAPAMGQGSMGYPVVLLQVHR
jgi:hypothetical protein